MTGLSHQSRDLLIEIRDLLAAHPLAASLAKSDVSVARQVIQELRDIDARLASFEQTLLAIAKSYDLEAQYLISGEPSDGRDIHGGLLP